jgi:hypothetical protein
VSPPAQVVSEPEFRIEIQASADESPKFSVTNLAAKTLTACTIEFSISTEARPQDQMNWDSLLQEGRGPKLETQGPLEPGQTLTLFLPHSVGGPLPDKVEIIAGIWADGETFGQTAWVKLLVDRRTSVASAYEQAIALLQEGIEHNWTREQYLAALNSKSDSAPMYSIRKTLLANQGLDTHPQLVKHVAQGLSAHFEQNLQVLQPQKSAEQVRSAP